MPEPIVLTLATPGAQKITINPEQIVYVESNGSGTANVHLTSREYKQVSESPEQVTELWIAALRGPQVTGRNLGDYRGFGDQQTYRMEPPETPETPTPAVTPDAPGAAGRNKPRPPETK